MPILRPFALVSLLHAACGSSGSVDPVDADPPFVAPDAANVSDGGGDCNPVRCRQVAGLFPIGAQNLDLLFVIDNSVTMAEEQDALAAAFPAWINRLDGATGLPNLHIGVVSTNMGDGPFAGSTQCEGAGDAAILQDTPRGTCEAPTDRYIVDEADGAGGRATNYGGALGDAFACIARLGTTGCGFERPFDAMQRALDGSRIENAGFLRDDAFLAVIFVGDEDDCSVHDDSMFEPSGSLTSPLGPYRSYRCTEFGVLCDGSTLPRTAGDYTTCEPRESPYMHHSDVYADFLRGLKPPGTLFVSAITGPATPFSVALDSIGEPELQPSCGAATVQTAAPGVRYQAFVDAFPERGQFTPICASDWSDSLAIVASVLGTADNTGSGCLTGELLDSSPNVGVQADCRVYDVEDYGLPSEMRTEIDPCGTATCFQVDEDPASCPSTSQHLRLVIDRTIPPAPGTLVVAECFRP